jgi:cell division septation protein DedD
MRGVFDEREAERSRKRRGREGSDEEKPDREVTLGSFTLLAILFGLVMLCGLSFGLGYVVGRKEPAASSTMLEPKPIAAPGDSWKSKPPGGTGTSSGSSSGSGAADEAAGLEGAEGSGQHAGGLQQGSDTADAGVEAAAAEGSKGTQNSTKSGAGGDPGRQAPPAVSDPSKSSQSGAKLPQQSQSKLVQPALGVTVQPVVQSAMKNAQSAAPLALMVQIATLAHQEDADVLVDALRRRGYAVAAKLDLADGMVHVRVGPFASRDVANQWKQKLLNDGYNAVVE